MGAYEGGVVAGLLEAVRALGEDVVVIDSIGAASAGSLTGVLAAFSLLRGADPIDAMIAAWVTLDDLSFLATHNTQSPLSGDALTNIATEVFGSGENHVPDGPPESIQHCEVAISMALASLSGLSYSLTGIQGDTTVDASTFLDWYDVRLTTGDSRDRYIEVAAAAIASGSNAIGFPPKLLDRSADKAQYVAAGLSEFPASGTFWYTDGGTVDNEPLGRTIDLAQEIGSGDRRVFLLIHPDPPSPSSNGPWTQAEPLPSWLHAGTRSFSISRSQSVYNDLKRVAKTNVYLDWTDKAVAAITQGFTGAIARPGLSDQDRTAIITAFADSLRASLNSLRAEQQALKDRIGRTTPTGPAGTGQVDDVGKVINALVRASTGLESKDPVTVEVVSPMLDPTVGKSPAEQLAGVFLFHFGGFLDIRFRQSDFVLGLRNIRYWVEHCLPTYLPGTDLAPVLAKIDARVASLPFKDVNHGGASFKDLTGREKVRVGETAAHVINVLRHDTE